MRVWRSLLFVPADDERRLARAHERGADGIILDLEDGVAPAAKVPARSTLANRIADLAARGQDVIVRINGGWRDIAADLDACVCPGLSAILVPKAEDGMRLTVVAEMIAEWEALRGLQSGSVALIALVESPLGIANLSAIAGVPRVVGIALGTEDFSLALGVAPTREALDLPCRQIALAAAARSLMAFAVPFSIADFRDEDGATQAASASFAFGGSGALCVHPAQVTIANRVFTPSDAARADASAVLTAWAEAHDRGLSVASLNGRMIDRPVVERAKRLLGSRLL